MNKRQFLGAAKLSSSVRLWVEAVRIASTMIYYPDWQRDADMVGFDAYAPMRVSETPQPAEKLRWAAGVKIN